jgi:hypothetical protein
MTTIVWLRGCRLRQFRHQPNTLVPRRLHLHHDHHCLVARLRQCRHQPNTLLASHTHTHTTLSSLSLITTVELRKKQDELKNKKEKSQRLKINTFSFTIYVALMTPRGFKNAWVCFSTKE